MATHLIAEEDPFLIPLDAAESALQVKKTIRDMLAFTEQLVVNTETAYKKITSLYAQAREWKKCLESKRKELVDPFRKQMAAINDKAKELTDPLDQVISLANAKVNGYQAFLQDLKRQEEENLRSAAALFDAEDEVYIAPLEKVLRGDGAVTVTKTEKRFKVLDLTKVPLKYLMVNEKAVEQDLKLGINEIPGLEIWEETTTQLRVR